MIPKKTQAAILEAALSADFEPRFDAIREAAAAECRKAIAEQHPEFLRLAADPEARRYLYIAGECHPHDGENCLYRPVTGCFADALGYLRAVPTTWGPTVHRITPAVERPAGCDCDLRVSAGLERQYYEAWADMRAARTTIRTALASCRNVERLQEDFPELAQYLPGAAAPAAALIVPVADLRAQLARYGVGK